MSCLQHSSRKARSKARICFMLCGTRGWLQSRGQRRTCPFLVSNLDVVHGTCSLGDVALHEQPCIRQDLMGL